MAERGSKRISASVPNATKQAIENLAADQDVSAGEVIRTLLGRGLVMEAFIQRGGQVYGRDADGNETLLADSNGEYTPDTRRLFEKKNR